MIENLEQYFMPEHQFYLDNIQYNRVDHKISSETVYDLVCKDDIKVIGDYSEGINIIITRKLQFEPENLFELSVTFGALLKFSPENKDEIDWGSVNLAEQFKYNGDFVTKNLFSRISLLAAQITSSFGQAPMITPPGMLRE